MTTRFLKYFITAAIVLLVGGISYLYYTITIGDTWGLLERLGNLPDVVAVEDYHIYEGNAFFTLVLRGGGYLGLNSIGNTDLTKSDGIYLSRVGVNKISCKKEGMPVWSKVSAKNIQTQYLPEKSLDNIPQLIKHYNSLNELFSNMPLKFKFTDSEGNEEDWVCSSEGIGGQP